MHATDPAAGAEQRLRDAVADHLRQLDAEATALDRLHFHTDPASAAEPADLVIESGPERLDLKRTLFAALDEAAAPDVLLASSSSGLRSELLPGRLPAPRAGASSHTRSTRRTWCRWSRSSADG